MHGQIDVDEAEDRRFFTEVVNKSILDAISRHNEAFLDTFYNAMKEVFHGFPIDQVGPAYYNIPYPSTQGTNQAGTSHQEAALAGNDDVQQFRAHLSKFRVPLLIRCSIILDRQCSMWNSQQSKFRTK